jgi:hypothetical protein
MRLKPHRPSDEILSGESADVYFDRARRIAKRGRIPGITPSPRLKPVDLAAWRAGA